MEISFTCPHCGEVTLIDESFIGQTGPCRRCDAIVTVPKPFALQSPFDETASVRDESPSNFGDAFFRPVVESRDSDVELMCAPVSTRLRNLCFVAVVGLIVFLFVFLPMLLPIVNSHGPSTRLITQNGLKQIMLALRAYEGDNGHLPRAYYRDAQGEITLPWRAAILPYVEEQSIFDRYATSEPWNSPTNYSLTAKSVRVYRHPSDSEAARGVHTGYVAVTGPGSLFVEGKNMRLADCKLKPSETIVLVEIPVEAEVHWSEPVDVDLFVQHFRSNEQNDSERRFYWANGAECAFADGSVRRLTREQLEAAMQKMIASASPEDLRARFSAVGD